MEEGERKYNAIAQFMATGVLILIAWLDLAVMITLAEYGASTVLVLFVAFMLFNQICQAWKGVRELYAK